MMLRAYQYRIYPTISQQEALNKHFGSMRFIYNWALDMKIEAYKKDKTSLSRFDIQAFLPALKKEKQWLTEVNAQSVQYAVKCMDDAYKHFFKNKAGFPKFKAKHFSKKSFTALQKVELLEDKLVMPKFLDGIKIKLSRPIEGIIKKCTISVTSTGKYFASILSEIQKEFPAKKPITPQTTIGIDMGIKTLVVASDGRMYENNKYVKKELGRIKYLQRIVSRKVKGSNNRKKANLCVAKVHEKVRNQRTSRIHQITYALTHENQVDSIVAEDLNTAGMLKNHKLAQSISDASFGEMIRQLKYKCDWYGKNFIQIGRFEPSSRLCSLCGAKNQTLTLKDREWVCGACGALHDRDLNAAKNIKTMGLKKITAGGFPVAKPVELPVLIRS